jgi:hypothetical protein
MDNIVDIELRVGTLREKMHKIMDMMYTCVTIEASTRYVFSFILFNEIIWKDQTKWTPFKARVWSEDHVPFFGEVFKYIHGIGFCPYRTLTIAKPLTDSETDPNEEEIKGERVVKLPIPVVYRMGEFDLRFNDKTNEVEVFDVITDHPITTILWSTRCPRPSPSTKTFITAGGRLLPLYEKLHQVQFRNEEIAEHEANPRTILFKPVNQNLDALQQMEAQYTTLMQSIHRKKDGTPQPDAVFRVSQFEGYDFIPPPWVVSSSQLVRPVVVEKTEDVERRYQQHVCTEFSTPIHIVTGEYGDDGKYTSQALVDEARHRRFSEYTLFTQEISLFARLLMFELYGERHEIPLIPLRRMLDVETISKMVEMEVLSPDDAAMWLQTLPGLGEMGLKRVKKDDGEPKKKKKEEDDDDKDEEKDKKKKKEEEKDDDKDKKDKKKKDDKDDEKKKRVT